MKLFFSCVVCFILIIMFSTAFSADNKTIVETKIKQGALIVDVRTPEEYAEENFTGSVNIPLSEIPDRLKDLGDKQRPIIVYCRSGRRSAEAKKILVENGFLDVTDGGGLSDMPQK